MKLLLITYSYTPDLTPRAFRWSAVVGELVARGHEVHVLCASPVTERAEAPGPVIHRVEDWLLNGSKRVTVGASANMVPARGAVGATVRKLVRQCVRIVWRGLYWPDHACGWVIPALRKARALDAESGFDWIISSSHPFSGHLVGLLLKKKATSAPWLVDISDPFALMKEPSPCNRLLYGWLSKWVEGRVVAGADAISVTTESTRKLYIDHFSLDARSVTVIPPLLSLPAAPARTPRSDHMLRMVFVGTLYRRLRSPTYLLACATALKQAYPDMPLEVHFYGALNDCGHQLAAYTDIAAPFVFAHGMVDRVAVQQAMMDADVLVNIGNDSEAQLASKVVEYMAVGRPILNIISIEKDTSVAALADYPSVLTIRRTGGNPPAEIVDRLHRFLTHLPAVDARIPSLVRERYSPVNITRQYESLLGIDSSRDGA